MTTTGMNLSISAMGPCFISAAAYPSAWMYEISCAQSHARGQLPRRRAHTRTPPHTHTHTRTFSLSAPSSATGKLKPRPRYRNDCAKRNDCGKHA